jgi:MFS family permease
MTTDPFGRKAALLLCSSLTVMSNATIAAAMPRMAAVFRDTPHAEFLTKLILTTPALLIVLFAPLAGVFIDRFGRVRFLWANLVLYGFAGASGFVLDDLHEILAGRALLGVAVAGIMTTTTTLLGDYFSGEARIRFAGTQSLFMSLGGVVFIGAGGLLADFDWRAPFLIYLASWLILVPAILFLDEPVRHAHHGTAEAERRAPIGALALAYSLIYFALVMFYMTPVQLPFLLRDIGFTSSALAAGPIVVGSLASGGGAIFLPRLRRSFGYVVIYALSMMLIALGYGIISLTESYAVLLAGAAVSGFGVGIIFTNSGLWVTALAPARLRGRLLGMMTASVYLGQFSSPILVEPAVTTYGIAGAFAVFAVIAGAVSITLVLFRRRMEWRGPRAT